MEDTVSDHLPVEPERRVISLSDEEGAKQVLRDSILELWNVVNNLTRLQPTRRAELLREWQKTA
jgi:hypothetical protein